LEGAFRIGSNADGAPVHDVAYTQVASAMQTVFDSAKLLGDAAELASPDDPTAARRLRASAAQRLATARKSIESATNAIDARRAQLETEIEQDLTLPQARSGVVENLQASNILARLRSLGGVKAFDAVRAAIANDDLQAVSAVLAASPLSASLDYSQHRMLRQMAEAKFSPRSAMRSGLEKLASVVGRAGDILNENYSVLAAEGDGREARKERALRALETNGGQN
jgi:hypothetical protein